MKTMMTRKDSLVLGSVFLIAVPAMLAPATLGQDIESGQDITSPDGMWRATLDSGAPSGPIGQIVTLFGPWAPDVDNLFETLWYEASSANNQFTWRVEDNYDSIFQNVGPHSAQFSAIRNDEQIRLDVEVTMLNGSSGGAQFDLQYTNIGDREGSFKPFAYADLDVAGTFGNDFAEFLDGPGAVEQRDLDAGKTLWFGGMGPYKSWEIDLFPVLRGALDAGRSQLISSGGGGPDDFTAALAGEKVLLGPGDSVRISFGLGGVGIPAPGALALLGLAGLVGTRRRRA